MAELDQVYVCNPSSKDFIGEHGIRFNGELYSIRSGEEGYKPQHLARHMAKHLSDYMIALEIEKEVKVFEKKKEKMPEVKQVQMSMYDNPLRRISLYKILKNKTEVERTIKAYPQFKAQDNKFNFVGDIREYDDFVAKLETPPSKEADGKKVTEKVA